MTFPFAEVFSHMFGAAETATLTWEHYIIAVIYCLAILVLGFIVARIVRAVLHRVSRHLEARTRTNLDEYVLDSLNKPVYRGLLLGTLYTAWALYPYSHFGIDGVVYGVLFVLAALVGIRMVLNPLLAIIRWYGEEAETRSGMPISTDFIPLIRKLLTVAVYTIGAIIVLEHFGVDIVALVTTLGVASLAVAMAAQETLSNMISGFVLMTDRPFRKGDRVKIGDIYGDVTRIGMRSTDVKTLGNTVIVLPNSKVAAEYIENYSYPDTTYRIKLDLGLAYGTDPNKALEVMVQTARATKGVLNNPEPAAFFLEFGDSSLNFVLLAWCETYSVSWVVQNDLMLNLHAAFAEHGMEIPFPTQTLHIARDNGA
ncbi:MAG: mechanosensitive ion channel [Candidatus Coatesbacteria bacterium]|nr:mechanosensitive ion channel [Candidatus Coatesbacteria bacterium]